METRRTEFLVCTTGPGLIILASFVAVGRLMDHPQFHIVGLIAGAGMGTKAATGNAWFLVAAGALVALIGAVQLVKFMQSYPQPGKATIHDAK